MMEQFLVQFFGCCFVVLPNPLTKCYTVDRYNRTWSVFNCTLLFNLPDIIFDSSKRSLCYTRYCSWRSMPLFQKCKIAERLVFNEFDFRCCDISFSNGKNVLFLHLPILLYQNAQEKSFEKFQDMLSRSWPIYRAKTFALYCISNKDVLHRKILFFVLLKINFSSIPFMPSKSL